MSRVPLNLPLAHGLRSRRMHARFAARPFPSVAFDAGTATAVSSVPLAADLIYLGPVSSSRREMEILFRQTRQLIDLLRVHILQAFHVVVIQEDKPRPVGSNNVLARNSRCMLEASARNLDTLGRDAFRPDVGKLEQSVAKVLTRQQLLAASITDSLPRWHCVRPLRHILPSARKR